PGPAQRLGVGELPADRHETGHLVLGQTDLMPAGLSQRQVLDGELLLHCSPRFRGGATRAKSASSLGGALGINHRTERGGPGPSQRLSASVRISVAVSTK